MAEHPSYMVEVPDALASSSSSSQGALAAFSASGGDGRRGRKSKVDSEHAEAGLTGAETIPVVHRETGKKVCGCLLCRSYYEMHVNRFGAL